MTDAVQVTNDTLPENVTGHIKRGRPKKTHLEPNHASSAYWLDEVFIDHGWAWATDLIETKPVDGRRCWQALPLSLGREDDVVPILKGYR